MMMGFQFLTPLIASVLYAIVFQKAGFRGATLIICAAPLLAAILVNGMYAMLGFFGMGMMLISIPLSLLPLLFLAFKSWPPVGVAANSRPEN